MNDNGGLNEFSNNILYNLKLGLEDGYYSLFTSSYKKEENLLNENLKSKILMACDSIKKNIDIKCEEPYYSNLIAEMPQIVFYLLKLLFIGKVCMYLTRENHIPAIASQIHLSAVHSR